MDGYAHDLRTGTRVSYRGRSRDASIPGPRVTGTVSGAGVFDRYTMETWIPVQPDGAPSDAEPALVRRGTIVEVISPADSVDTSRRPSDATGLTGVPESGE